MATASKLILYGCLICPYTQRVRSALEYLKVPYEYEEVDLVTNQQQSAWYTAINPLQKVPTIKHNNNLIFESLVVFEYLQEVFAQGQGGPTLYPSSFDAVKRAQERIWVRVFEDRVISHQPKIYQQLIAKDNDGLRETVKAVQSGLKYVANHSGLTQRLAAAAPGEQLYSWGKEPSLADFALLPNLNNIVLILKLGGKIDVFESIEESDKEHLQAFSTWYAFAVQDPNFQLTTYKIASLPPADRSQIISENSWSDVQQWDYITYWSQALLKRTGYKIEA